MLALLVGGVALVAGLVVGYLLRGSSARAEKTQLELGLAERVRELSAVREELKQAQQIASDRAGFETLAAERGKLIEGLRQDLELKSNAERGLSGRVGELEAELRNERQNMAEKLQLLETAKQALANQFEALAAEILEKKTRSFSEGSQKELGTLLTPLKAQIEEFRKKVEEAQTDSKTGVATLQGLVAGLSSLNQQLSEEARNLTTALRGSAKAQGDWGEFILRDLLEKAGLREGEQFTFQQSFAVDLEEGERGRTARTDVIVSLPGGRSLVIDSKVSLTAYTDYANAADDAARMAGLKQHLASVRGHVNNLAKAGYHRLPGIEAPDFVVLFVPVEPAFLLALQNDGALWSDAYASSILLVGPTTLLYIIRIVNVLWQQEAQSRNVKDVMERGAKLYEKFVGFVSDLEEVGKSLRNASSCYEDATKKLSAGGGLIRQVEMLRRLGVKPRKTIPARLLELAEAEPEGEEAVLALAAEADSGE